VAGRPQAVLLTGLRYEFDWAAYLSSCFLRIPIWLRTETQDQAFRRSFLKALARHVAYRFAYWPVSKALVIGRLNGEHYRRHGLGARRQISSPYCVVDRYADLSPEKRESMRHTLRSSLTIAPRKTVLLFCGKLQPKKNPMLLLDALAALPTQVGANYAALFVGAGELEIPLRVRARELPHIQVIFAGFQNQTQLAPWYLASDILVLPSRQMGETWGLVVNEALLAGCGVILSQHVGCHADFSVLPSVRVFDGTIADFVHILRRHPPQAGIGDGDEVRRRYSVTAAAAGLRRALEMLEPHTQCSAVNRTTRAPIQSADAVSAGVPGEAGRRGIVQTK